MPRLLFAVVAVLFTLIFAIIFDTRFVGFASLVYGVLSYFLPGGRIWLQKFALHFSVGALLLLVRYTKCSEKFDEKITEDLL